MSVVPTQTEAMADYTLEPEIVSQLQKCTNSDYWVGIDVGGTNTRIALLYGTDTDYILVKKFQSSCVNVLIEGIAAVGSQVLEIYGKSPLAGCLAAAGPIENQNEVIITNYTGEKELSISQLPDEFFPHSCSSFINDLEGTCAGMKALSSEGKLSDYFDCLWGPEDSDAVLHSGNNLVLAMGTGLGTALLVGKNNDHFVLPMEAGHIFVTPLGSTSPNFKDDNELISFISNKLYNGEHCIEFEDICSGRGLVNVYEWLMSKKNEEPEDGIDAAEIVRRGLDEGGCSTCLEALDIHYLMLMRNAQTLAVQLQVKAVFVAGDNQVNNFQHVRQLVPQLKETFLNHVKKDWIDNTYVYSQTSSYNFNLLGALYTAFQVHPRHTWIH
eukprot:TRINITY_DN2489_c0_g1_i1.p1 TRINITY_DN2489_c0_g1~~TRINITY_DN2489_c0_g1_i1.p1  ORF type:complete len:383 (+),score=70.62 TRINITY_DN2489_c0_g1_i1:45-1193(+)